MADLMRINVVECVGIHTDTLPHRIGFAKTSRRCFYDSVVLNRGYSENNDSRLLQESVFARLIRCEIAVFVTNISKIRAHVFNSNVFNISLRKLREKL